MLWIPHQLVGVSEGFDVTLECFSEAHPTSLNYWTKGDGQMIHVSQKYRLEFTIIFVPFRESNIHVPYEFCSRIVKRNGKGSDNKNVM